MQRAPIACLGAGQMATALARGLVRTGFCAAGDIVAFDPDEAARARFSEAIPGSAFAPSNAAAVRQASVVLLAVKPQKLADVADEVRATLGEHQLVVSLAAGIHLARLGQLFGTGRIVRVMPNTPCLVGWGASAFALGSQATAADAETVRHMLASVGIAFELDESLLDAVTGLSGSGPAYVYLFIEALSDGGVQAGLPRGVALALAAQTVRGAAEMVLAEREHPAVLKDRVTSPGGTTIAGLRALEEHGMRAATMAAVSAAAHRAREMGQSGG